MSYDKDELRAEVQSALDGESALFQSILEAVPGGVVHVGPDGGILLANTAAKSFLGLSYDELTQRYVVDFEGATYREDGSPCPVEEYPVARCLMTGTPQGPTTIGVRQPSGDIRWAVFTAIPFTRPGAERPGAVVTFLDVTERKRIEEQHAAYASLLETIRQVQARFIAANGAGEIFEEILGHFCRLTESPRGFLGLMTQVEDETLIHLFEPAGGWRDVPPSALGSYFEPVSRASGNVVHNQAPSTGDTVLEAFGRPRRFLGFPLHRGTQTVGFVVVADRASDYSPLLASRLEPLAAECANLIDALDTRRERERLRTQLAQADRLASVGTLAAGIAHEVNNPLAYILLNLQSMEHQARSEAAGADPRLAAQIQDAMEGAVRVRDIVKDLMTFARVSTPETGPVDLSATVETALKMAFHEIKYRARLTKELARDVVITGNDGRLVQVFLNLLLNAARAIVEGDVDRNEIRVRTWIEDGHGWAEIRDTGVGIPSDRLQNIFDPFVTTRGSGHGSGLGLSICYRIVADHGGHITVESEEGRGASFRVMLPLATAREDRAPQPAPAPAARDKATQRLRLLLVDDEPGVRRALANTLADDGYHVVTAASCAEAIGVLERESGFDIVLCDMMMLDSTGVEVYEWVQLNAPSLQRRIIFMTGGTFTPRARAFLDASGAPLLQKPFPIDELHALATRLCRES